MIKRMMTAVVIVAAVFASSGRADDPGGGEVITPRYVWQAGMTTYYRHVVASDGTIGAMKVRSMTATLYRQEVYSVKDDGTGRVAMTVIRVRKEEGTPTGGTKVYDSRAPEETADEMERKLNGAMVGRTIIAEFTPDGRMVRQEGMEEALDSILKSLDAKGTPLEPMLEGLRKSFGEMASEMTTWGGVSPGPGHRVNEEWTSETDRTMPMLGSVKDRTVRTIESVRMVDGRRIVTTSLRGEGGMKSAKSKDSKDGAAPAFSAGMDVSTTTTGSEVFDLDRGRLIRSESVASMTGSVSMPAMGGEERKSMKIENTSRTVIELVGPEDPLVPEKR